MKSRSDFLYKQLFAHPEIVRDLLAGFLPAAWSAALDVDAFERINASYASEHGKARHEDMVWRARVGGEWVYVYILLEFQARADKWMALRMQVYVGLLYQDLVAQHRLTRGGKLPPVVPIVLYHGRAPWRASLEMSALMLAPPVGLEPYQPALKYLLIDQHRNLAAPGDSNVVSILFRVLRSRSDAQLREALELFATRMKAADMAPVRENLARWMQTVLQEEFSETNIILEEDPGMLFDKRFKKYEDLLEYEAIERGRVKGRIEGREEGREEGLKEGLRAALESVVQSATARHGKHVPEGTVEQIAAADSAQLTRWLKALLEGASPHELFARADGNAVPIGRRRRGA